MDAAERQRDELLEEIKAAYEVDHRKIEFGRETIEVIRASDPDRVLDEAVQSEEFAEDELSAWEPYWAEAWDSANAIGAWLYEQAYEPRQVIDLGCGLGVAGCVAAALGANVVLGDNAPPCIKFATWNSWPWREQVNVRHLDWRADRLEAKSFDLILGADIVYARENWDSQIEFCDFHLAENGEILFAEPNRRLSDEFESRFRLAGWQSRSWQYEPACVEKPIRMYSFTRAA